MEGKGTRVSTEEYTQRVIDAIVLTAAQLECECWEVSIRDIKQYTGISEHVIYNSIGIKKIKAAYFPMPVEVGEQARAKEVKKYVAGMEKRLGDTEYFLNTLESLVTKNIQPIKTIAPPVFYKENPQESKLQRELIVMLNDTHYGLIVNKDEVAGVNSYGWTEASRRTAYLIKQACQFKPEHRRYTEKIHLILNGDLLAGIIHGTLSRDLELLTNQVNGALHILVHAVNALLKNFKYVDVHFTFGNHGDMVHRREGGRVTSQAYDNYESILFYALSAAFRGNPRATFNATRTLFGSIDLMAGRLIYTHGHTLFSKELGNPGTQIKAKQLSDAIMRFNTGEMAQGRKKASVFFMGHTHVDFSMMTPDGVLVHNIASMSGIDPYAFALTINHNLTQQLLVESTAKHIFGDNRKVNVNLGDGDKELDKIIPIYKNELVWRGSVDVA